MSQTKIEKLTFEQEAAIPLYREKWRAIALSTEPIDRQKATEAVKAAYAAIGEKEPYILFCDSPYAAHEVVLTQLESQLESHRRSLLGSRLKTELRNQLESQLRSQFRSLLGSQLRTKLETQLKNQLRSQLNYKVSIQLGSQMSVPTGRRVWNQLSSQMWNQVYSQMWNHLEKQLRYQLRSLRWSIYCNCAQPGIWASKACLADFYTAVINCEHDKTKGEALQLLVKYCDCIYPFEKICIVCDRPIKLSFDNQQRLHAIGEPAIQFADGYSFYAYDGVILPKEYGKMHPDHWQAEWILKEINAEVRRVLIQGIGYARICQELQANELDYWQEYTLLRINVSFEREPIYLLKMTCPSTGHIHALRVPPNVASAREAIRWVNWGTDPEEFSVQT